MKVTFQHELFNSFYLWFDSFLLRRAEAYSNKTSNFYYYQDDQLPDKVVFGSPFKQFVYDKSCTGATIIDSVSGDGSLITKGVSGMTIDYDNGRIIFDSGFNTGISISGSFCVKDFNVYPAIENEEELINENAYETNSRFLETLTNVTPYAPVMPAAFLSCDSVRNEEFALGVEDKSICNLKAVVFSQTVYELDGILSTFSDSYKSVFYNIPFTGMPLNEYGDVKSSHYPNGYYYTGVSNANSDSGYLVDQVYVSKLSDSVRKLMAPNIFVGFIDFEVTKYRFPRL